MERQSVTYGCIVFLALVFADLGVTGIAAISGPAAAMLLHYDALRAKRNDQGGTSGQQPAHQDRSSEYSVASEIPWRCDTPAHALSPEF